MAAPAAVGVAGSFAQPDDISAAMLAREERRLTPLIEAADKRAISASAPTAALELLSAAEMEQSTVRPLWDSLPVASRRQLVAALFETIRVGKSARPLSRWADDQLRLDRAARARRDHLAHTTALGL